MTILSIIIPFYNDPENIVRCIDSIAAALAEAYDFQDMAAGTEIIVVDDNSPVPFLYPDAPVAVRKYRLPENKGVGTVRNFGASHAKGEYLLFVDSDVILDINHFNIVFEEISGDSPPAILQGPTSVVPANRDAGIFQKYLAVAWNYYEEQNWQITFFTQCVLVDKGLFMKMGGFAERYTGSGGEEFEFALRLGLAGEDLIRYRDDLIHYHHFDRIVKRLRKVYFRSRYITSIALEMPNLSGVFKAQVLMRSAYSLMMNMAILLMLFKPAAGAGLYLGLGLLLGFSDWSQTRHMRRHYGMKLAVVSVVFRHLEYLFINLGILAGYMNRVRGRNEDGRQKKEVI